MHALWLVVALVAASPEVDDGSLLFLQNCNSLVEFSTGDEIGHVAIAFREQDETWVYEATPGKVRRVTLATYEEELARLNARRGKWEPIRLWVLTPEKKYAASETAAMQEFLDEQLGRRYSVKNYVRGKPGDGTHCAELAANTLNRSGRFDLADCHQIDPAKLLTTVARGYSAKVEYPIGSLTTTDAWYVRWGRCCTASCNWCGWSCREAWSFCW